ncbi:type II toxin-antitoxin system RelE family toxin [Terracidiphilus sp.]|jgi:mRNA interferase RelE/StbE|uniref:type II toxin-antitoxin system RelE family toxin n=1 Tax=Terracidiphilus sp. TaxID=1964191 RepID=UPI003C24037F
MAWSIELRESVRRDLRKYDPQIARRILKFLNERVARFDNPRSIGEALSGSKLGNFWKYRVGDWRIICDIQDDKLVVLVLDVGNRREIYER